MRIYGISLLGNRSEEETIESGMLGFFSSESIYLRRGSTTDILMPGLDRPAIQIISDFFQRRYPDYEVCNCSHTLRDLASVGS